MAMDRAMDTSTSSAIPPAILSRRTLNIKDLDELIALLERHHYNKASYHQLGLRLKLSYNTLEKIKKNHGEVDPCFTECLAGWLRKPDGVETPTIDTLIAALRGIEENAVADGIEGERQRILAPAPMAAVPLSRSDEPMVATPPTSHTSEGHLIQPVATVNPGVVDLELKIDRYPELQEIANNLQGKYDFLVSALEKSLKDHHIDVKRAKRLIERCLMTKAGVVSELKPCIDIFEKANDFESFFDFLSKYKFIGYINYKLLKKLAELVKDDEINNRFYEYEKEYTKLLSSASFQDIIPLLERKSELSPTAPLGLPYVSFRLERPWLHTVVYIWISTFGEFSWSSYALLKQLRENCVIITYAILPCVLDDVIRDLKDPVILKKLEDKDVTVIEIIESPQKEEVVHDAAKNIKDLEDKLKQHERDLEDTSSELKIKDELCQKAKEELEEEQRICGEKIEEANTNYAQRKKETQRDMEEQLQILRQESSQALALKGMVSALVNELVEMGLINVTNVVTDVKDNMTDMKSGMKQTAQKIKETQRQMSDKMNETTEELSKKMEEQGTAFRDEVQSTTSRLKDELAAKTDEQVEGMTEKIKTDVKEAIIANIVASSAPVQETTYTAFEEDQNPHDQETSHHILSSSSSNCGNDTYSMQETHDILREDPTIASMVFSGNIDIKERANVDLTRLADKLKANKIISQGDRDKAVDGYTKQTEAQRRGELIDRVHENLREGIGGAFEIFLDILREEDTLQLNKLVADLERSYDEIGGLGAGAKVGSEAKPQYILTIGDLGEVVSALQKHHFTTTHWDRLCLSLGILYHKLKDIKDNHPRKAEQQLREGLSEWLRLQYQYEKYGKPTWRTLVNTLEKINERVVAEGIRKDKFK